MGAGDPITIPPEQFSKRENSKFTQVNTVTLTVLGKTAKLSAPDLKDGAEVSGNYGVNINCFPEFAFDKISCPEYGVGPLYNGTGKEPVAWHTGVPYYADFMRDYYFISLFRLADKLTTPGYSGRIKEQFSTPNSKS